MERKAKNLAKIYVWLITGILLCISAAWMKTSDSFNFEQFLENGDVYDYPQEELMTSTDSCVYDAASNTFMTKAVQAYKTFLMVPETKTWGYLSLNIANLNVGYSDWKIEYANSKGAKVGEQVVRVITGENVIPISLKDSFCNIQIVIENQPNVIFTLKAVQLRDSATFLDALSLLGQIFIYFFIYLVVTVLVWLIKNGYLYHLVELLQYIFIIIGDYLGSKVGGKLTMMVKNRLRTILFFILFVYMTMWCDLGFYQQTIFYKYGILVSVILLILIGLISWEHPLHYVRWDGVLPLAWLILWTMVCISDFAVSKFYKFTGYAFLFGVGFFFFTWNNMERPKWIRNNMVRALAWTVPLNMVYCFLFRQKKEFVLYNGPFLNRESLASYAVVTLVAFLAELYYCLLYSKVVFRKMKLVLFGIGVCVSWYYLYLSYSMICILAGLVVTLLFMVFLLQRRNFLALGMARSIGMLCMSAVCAILVVVPFHMALKSLPSNIGKNVVYTDERLETRIDTETLASYKISAPNTWNGVQSASAVDIKQVWSEYLGRMNLFGHDNILYYEHQQTMACNGMIEMAYRYGIFILVPYSLLLLSCLYRAWKERGYLMLAITVAFGIVMMTQNIEQPFAQPLWIIFYLGMGGWFVSEKENREVTMHETDSNRTLLQ